MQRTAPRCLIHLDRVDLFRRIERAVAPVRQKEEGLLVVRGGGALGVPPESVLKKSFFLLTSVFYLCKKSKGKQMLEIPWKDFKIITKLNSLLNIPARIQHNLH